MEEIWFKDGLSFHCTGCGKCCTGADGCVFLSHLDVENLARRFEMPIPNFLRKYTRLINGEVALLDRVGSGDCIFLKDNRCSVYEDRPIQCRTFPWWIQNLRKPSDWEEAALHCEGINCEGAPIISSEEIQENCFMYVDNMGDT